MKQNNLDPRILQQYADAGFTLFPLNGKIPPKGFHWTEAQFNPLPRPADFPSGNFGVKLSEEDLVIDIDPRNFPEGRKVQDEFNSAVGHKIIGYSFTVRTGGGGAHVYLRKPHVAAVRRALADFPGIEFKSKGNYLVGAQSIHPDTGKPYTVFTDSPNEIKDAPQTLLDLISRDNHKPETAKGPVNYVDDQQTQDRFIQYLKTAPLAIEGAAGDKTTFSVAAVGHDFGLHPDICLSLMAEHYNPKCEPPWSPQQLKIKVYNAYRYSGELAGVKSAQNKFTAAPVEQTAADLRCNQRGEPFNTVYNTVTAFNIDLKDTLAFNIWTEDIIFLKAAPWHDEDDVITFWEDSDNARLKYYMGKTRRFEPKTQTIEEALITVSRYHKFHPIKQEIESYVWDGIPRIKDWLVKYIGAEDNAYHRNVGLKVLVAAIKRLY